MKKTPRKRLVKNLDDIASLIARKRDKQCVVCGNRNNLQGGHVFSRGHYSTRWDLLNIHCQCGGCNLKHTYDQVPYHDWFKQRFGEKQFKDLYRKYTAIRKWTDKELQELLKELQTYFKELE